MNIVKKRQAAGAAVAYLLGKGAKHKAARVNATLAAFIDRFVNGSWAWTRYFCAAILENIKVVQAERSVAPSFSLNLGASGRALSEFLWTGGNEPSAKVSEKNVLHKARTNPQAA